MGLILHPMKEIRVIVAGEQRAFVTDLLDRVNATGYTIIGNVSGKGHHGVREAHACAFAGIVKLWRTLCSANRKASR